MKSNIRDHLPEPTERKLIQAWVPTSLRARVALQMKQEQISWNQLVTAACEAYLSEAKPKTKERK